MTKFRLYAEEGVAWYCIVDPENHVIKIYKRVVDLYVKQADIGLESYSFDLDKHLIAMNCSAI